MSITNLKGDIGEAAFALEATKRGYWVAKLPQDCPYDYVLDKRDGNLLRVQVKYRTVNKNGTIGIKLINPKEVNKSSYTSDTVDCVAVYVSDFDKTYLIPVQDISGTDEVFLRCVPTKNNQASGVRMIDAYDQW